MCRLAGSLGSSTTSVRFREGSQNVQSRDRSGGFVGLEGARPGWLAIRPARGARSIRGGTGEQVREVSHLPLEIASASRRKASFAVYRERNACAHSLAPALFLASFSSFAR